MPCSTLTGDDQLVAGLPLSCLAKYIAASAWLLHITPTAPFSDTTEEMSSGDTAVVLGRTNGVPQAVSLPLVALTQTWLPRVHVAHRTPVESLSITIASIPPETIVTGK